MKGHYGPGRFECTAPAPKHQKGKFMFRHQMPGELDAEYNYLKGEAQARFNRIEGRKGGLEKARKSGPRTSADYDEGKPFD